MYWCKSGLSGSSCLCNTCIQKDTAHRSWTINRAQEKKPNQQPDCIKPQIVKGKLGTFQQGAMAPHPERFQKRYICSCDWYVPCDWAMAGLVRNPFMTSVMRSVSWGKNAFHPTGSPNIKPNLRNRITESKILLALCMCYMLYATNWNTLIFYLFFVLF